MTFTKRCKCCGELFKTTTTRRLYCSLECKDKAARQRQREWNEAHPGYFAERMRASRARKA